jgi:hypothetical protein
MTKLQTIEKRLDVAVKTAKGAQVAFCVGLAQIAEEELWRGDGYKSWSEYCLKRWNVSRQRGYQIIEYAEVLKGLPQKVSSMLDSLRTVEALAEVPEDRRLEVAQKAEKSGHISTRSVKEQNEHINVILDEIGRPIPESVLEDWNRAETFAETIALVSRVKTVLEKLLNGEDIIAHELTNGTISEVKHIYFQLKQVLPHSICPTCNGGAGKKKCTLCGKRGFISKYRWDNVVPKETKAIIEKSITK